MGWIENLLKKIDRRTIPITYHPHFVMRESTRNLSLRYVEMTVRSGRINKRNAKLRENYVLKDTLERKGLQGK